MADHTLLHGVQAALDRRLRNRQLDLQAQGMQMMDEDRDQRERDMRQRIIEQHNLSAAKLAANANKPDPNAWREGWQAAITQRELEQERIRQAGGVEKENTRGGWGVKKEETKSDAMLDANKGHDDTRVKVEEMGIKAGKYNKAPRGGGGGGSNLTPLDKEIMEREKTIAGLVKSINAGDWGQASKFVPEGMRSDQKAIKDHLAELKKLQADAIKARNGESKPKTGAANNPP